MDPVVVEIPHVRLDCERDFGRKLSETERACLVQLFLGKHNREIAQAIGTSEHTVKNHFHSIFLKLGIAHTRELFPYVIMAARELRA